MHPTITVSSDRLDALHGKLNLIRAKEEAAYAEYKRREAEIAVEPAKQEWLELFRERQNLETLLAALQDANTI